MKRLKKLVTNKIFIFTTLFILFIYVNNSSLLVPNHHNPPLLLAHRGLAQTFPIEGVENDTCTAQQIYPPEHPYLENTIPSIQAAFDAGANIVELDVHLTKDQQFAVFHDWTLDCRTNGKGVTREHTLAELKQLDIGYGYTHDHGKTYPFRGKGIGLMPSLTEVLNTFPNQSLLIHVKSNDPKEGELLAKQLSKLPVPQQKRLTVYGGDEPIQSFKQQLPEIRVMSKATMKKCLIPYVLIGWTGYVPEACKQTQLHIPDQIAPLLWGWPYKFQHRMDHVDTRVVIVKGNGTSFSDGFDTPEDIQRLPAHYSGVIWTNRIDRIAPLYSE